MENNLSIPTDTIAALATAPGEAGIAVIRVSGPLAFAIADRVVVCRPPSPSSRATHHAFLARIREENGRLLDQTLVLPMRGPRSYTGEDVVEFQCHGGRLASRQILAVILAAGARVAEPGEFTRRAFLNGKLDLLQAEAVLDLIRARSDRAARVAYDQLQGSLSQRVGDLIREIMAAAAAIEVSLDFIEDEFVNEDDLAKEALTHARTAKMELERLLATANFGRILREGFRVAILGPPNAGKSTLFNALLGFDRSIVTPHPGTTRDTIEDGLLIDGIAVRLTDTAGIRETACEIESAGVHRARMELMKSDVVVYVVDALMGLTESDRSVLELCPDGRTVVVCNKTDLCGESKISLVDGAIPISAIRNQGVEKVRSAIINAAANSGGLESDVCVSERHAQHLRLALGNLAEAENLLTGQRSDRLTLAALHIRSAAGAVGEITGNEYHPELLNSIFGRFCVGK